MDINELRSSFPEIDPLGFASVMQSIGGAALQLQVLEEVAQTSLVVLQAYAGKIAPASAARLLEGYRRRTLGQLVREYEMLELLPGSIAQRLPALVEPRNWLVHRCLTELRGALATHAGRTQISAKVDAIADEASKVQSLLARHVSQFCLERGANRDVVMRTAHAEIRARYGV